MCKNYRIAVKCSFCGMFKLVVKSKKDSVKFCSKLCQYNSIRKPENKNIVLENKYCSNCNISIYKKSRSGLCYNCYYNFKRINKICLYCKNNYICIKSLAEISKFCSKTCKDKQHSLNMIGENNPAYTGERICKDCKKPLTTCGTKRCWSCYVKYSVRENHPSWKGGIVHERNSLNTIKYKKWRLSVFKRDKFVCQMPECLNPKIALTKKKQLQAHHIKKRSEFPELIHEIENGITLCKNCHIYKVNGKEKEYEQIFSEIVRNKKCLKE